MQEENRKPYLIRRYTTQRSSRIMFQKKLSKSTWGQRKTFYSGRESHSKGIKNITCLQCQPIQLGLFILSNNYGQINIIKRKLVNKSLKLIPNK